MRASGLLGSLDYASVTVLTLAFPAEAIRSNLTGTGFLVPRTSEILGHRALITGCTYLSRKWPHLARPGDELIRLSVGRYGDTRPDGMSDDELVAAATAELASVLSVTSQPTESRVTRWHSAFPQYPVGHLTRVAQIHESISSLPGLAVAGAAYHGVGIPACIGSGRAAAHDVRRTMAATSSP
jgi:oxygen-dependent protoporphyrinogen oxidase